MASAEAPPHPPGTPDAAAASTAPPAPAAIDPATEFYRLQTSRQFTLQLELLCSLSSPSYLYHLSLSPAPDVPPPLAQPSFIRYLAHLYGTWSTPQYARYVTFPNGLFFCKLLVESPDFRRIVASQEWENETANRLVEHWATWRREGGNAVLEPEQPVAASVS